MALNARLTWTPSNSAFVAKQRVYASDSATHKGTLIATLSPSEYTCLIEDLDEVLYWFRVLAVSKSGVEENWRLSKAVVKHRMAKAAHQVAPITAQAQKPAVGLVDNAQGLRVSLDAVDKDNPPTEIEVVKGDDAETGQLVARIPVDRANPKTEFGQRHTFTLPALPGQGAGVVTPYTIRPVAADGKDAGPVVAGISFNVPTFKRPNHEPQELASLVTGTKSGWVTALETDKHEFGTYGVRAKLNPATTNATGFTSGSNNLGDEFSGAYYYTTVVVPTTILDMLGSKEFMLELYDQWHYDTAVGAMTFLQSGQADFPSDPAADPKGEEVEMSPFWAAHLLRSNGHPAQPHEPVFWEYRVAESIAALTAQAWQVYVPGIRLKGRYLDARMTVRNPLGYHQPVCDRAYVRAWVPWSEDHVPPQNLPVAYAGAYVTGGVANITLGTVPKKLSSFTAATPTFNAEISIVGAVATVSHSGVYKVDFQSSFTGSTGSIYTIRLYKNGIPSSFAVSRKLGTGGDVGSCSFTSLLTAVTGATFAIYGSTDGNNKDYLMIEGQGIMTRVG